MSKGTKSTLSKKRSNKRMKMIAFIVCFIAALFWLLPIVYMLGTSLKTMEEIIVHPSRLWPTGNGFTFDNYKGFIMDITSNQDGNQTLVEALTNSLIVSLSVVFLTILVDCLAAYAFAFLNFRNRTALYAFIIFSMTIPGIIGTTTKFSMYASMGNALDLMSSKTFNLSWLIFPSICGVYNLYLMKNFFDSVPKDIVESARSDGANDLRIFWSIILPLAKSTMLLIGLFAFTGSWNDLFWSNLIVGGKEGMKTVTVMLQYYTGSGVSDRMKGVAMAASLISLLPILIVFVFTQNRMIEGMATTGVKR